METVLPGIHASAPQTLDFAPKIEVRAYLLERGGGGGGNVLIYNTGGALAADRAAMERLGPIARHYLGHEHEAGLGGDGIGAPLVCHEQGRAAVARHLPVAATFTERHRVDGDLEVIPIPGHTPGSTAYLWDSGRHRCLFTADTLYLREGGDWIGGLLPGSSDRDALIASLELLCHLDFDVLVPWAASRGGPCLAHTDRADAGRRIDAVLGRLRRGENG